MPPYLTLLHFLKGMAAHWIMWHCSVFSGPQEEFFYPELILYPNRSLCITYHDTLSLLTKTSRVNIKQNQNFYIHVGRGPNPALGKLGIVASYGYIRKSH